MTNTESSNGSLNTRISMIQDEAKHRFSQIAVRRGQLATSTLSFEPTENTSNHIDALEQLLSSALTEASTISKTIRQAIASIEDVEDNSNLELKRSILSSDFWISDFANAFDPKLPHFLTNWASKSDPFTSIADLLPSPNSEVSTIYGQYIFPVSENYEADCLVLGDPAPEYVPDAWLAELDAWNAEDSASFDLMWPED